MNPPLDKTTPDLVAEQVEKLKRLFPEVVTEGAAGSRVDFDRLRATLGDLGALAGDEAYTFTWAGREEAFRALQTPSAASLQPVPEESVDWEETRHLFIEGENLEVLKLLYKSYFGRVKMIYIDPPYNTGKDFIYRDDYSQPRRAYLEKTGQVDAEGNVLTSNPETRGRYHSAWLTMMYPRLFLARQLLREDGVIFVSIDDNEVHHLRLLMDEVFGWESFIGSFVWKSRHNVDSRNKTGYSKDHEYILAYGNRIRGRAIDQSKYSNPDNDRRGPWMSDNIVGLASADRRPNLHYDLINPETGINYGCPAKGWRYEKSTMAELISEGKILWPASPEGRPRRKKFISELQSQFTGQSSLLNVPNTSAGTQEIREIFGSDVFDFPKPLDLIKLLIRQSTAENDIVLDFFAGSAPVGHAVLEVNRKLDENRQFILIQIPEQTEEKSPAKTAGYDTIADIGKERIRRVIAQMQAEDEGKLDLCPDEDLGFKVFKLAPSTFREWERPADAEALEAQLSYFDAGLKDGADRTHALYEVLLKEGYSLNARIEALDLETNRVYRICQPADVVDADRCFYLCLDDALADETLDALPLDDQMVFICQDAALDDSQKVNLALGCILKTL